MGNPVDGTDGSVGGLVSSHDRPAATSFQAILKRWRFRKNARMREGAGFGDGGDSYPAPGISSWTFGAVGEVQADATAGVSNMNGANQLVGTVGFLSESGVSWDGSARMTMVFIETDYESGAAVFQCQGVGYGPLNER